MTSSKMLSLGASISLLALIALCVAWELWLAPVRPGGSWLVLKALPLLIPLPGILKQRNYTMQWSAMFILLYLTEGLVRATSDKGFSVVLAWLEVTLCVAFFFCTLFYLRPYKKLAKLKKAAAQNQAASSS